MHVNHEGHEITKKALLLRSFLRDFVFFVVRNVCQLTFAF